ncbi:DUF4097 family beta strand repeat-containing protein [Adhaeribacter radiodurans]|nr:DUF4097 family beta strand repeat-containing protein [Adhaeribacter radiodurans]
MKKILLAATFCALLTNLSWAQTAVSGKDKTKNKANVIVNSHRNDNDDDDRSGERREYKTKLGNNASNQVRFIMASSEVKIVGHNSDELVIEANNYHAPPARAQGLKPLYNAAEDNTGIGLSVNREGNVLTVIKAQKGSGKYTIRVPNKAAISYTEGNWEGGDFELADLDGAIELKLNNSRAELNNVAGPVIANSTNGGIQVKFKNLNQQKPSSISVVNGEIDITLPAATKANWKLRSINGEVYTDFDMALPKDKSDLQKIAGSNTVEGKTNGGGVEMNVYTINSDIFIRKSK